MVERGGEWDNEVLQDICNERDADLIRRIPLPMINKQDSWYWILDEKGLFTFAAATVSYKENTVYLGLVYGKNYDQ